MNRRNFIDRIFRGLMAGGLLAVSGFLTYRRKTAGSDSCTYLPVCDRCNLFTGCNKSAKQIRSQNGKGKQN